jgi:hypothetical protein
LRYASSTPTLANKYRTHTIRQVLNSNALIAALFLTFEFPLLSTEAAGELSPLRRKAMLYLAATSIVCHVFCIFISAEASFVLNQVKKVSERKQETEFKRLAANWYWKACEPMSGLTFLSGILLVMCAYGVTLSKHFGNPDGDAVMIALLIFSFSLFAFGWCAVGCYVNNMIKRESTETGSDAPANNEQKVV